MNTKTYRLIFNPARGCMMAVAETASSCSKSPSGASKARRRSSKCSKTPKGDEFTLSDKRLDQWIRAQAATDLIADYFSQTSSGRMQALAAASTALNVYNNAGAISEALTNPATSNPAAAARITLSLGTSKSQSNSSSQSDTARGSTVGAGRNINITATGAGQQSDLTIQGSSVKAGNNTTLTADNQINLLAAKNESSQTSTNSSSSSSVSVSYGAGGWGGGASASRGKGKSDGEDTTFSNTNVTAGNTATIKSGGDTNVIGAVVQANTSKADIGGSLKIESLQDKSTYTSSQQSMGASVTVGGGGNGASVSASKSNIDSSFQSVNQQSGLKAGDGGFQVNVASNTALVGAVIASTQSAVDNNKNTFTTGGSLTITDVQNTASFKGSGYSVSASFSQSKDASGNNVNKPGGSFGVGSTGGNASSVNSAGISGIAGNTAVRTGDAETGLKPIFDAAKVQKEINAQIAITSAFGQQASKAIGDFALVKTNEAKALRNQAGQDGISQGRKDALNAQAQAIEDNWGDTGTLRLLAHSVVGGLTGGVGGAAGAAAGTLAAPMVADALRSAGVDGALATTITALASTAAGALAGGTAGAAAGFNEVVNNYLNHADASKLLALQKKQNAGTLTAQEKQERDALIQKDLATSAQLNGCAYSTTTACKVIKDDFAQAQQSFLPSQVEIQKWATDKAASSPYTAAQLTDAYNFAFTKGTQPPAQTNAGDLSGAYDWIVKDLSDSAKASGAPVLDKMYMGWATANAPSVAGGVTAAIIGGQALLASGVKVSTLPAFNKPPAPTAEEVSAAAKARIEQNARVSDAQQYDKFRSTTKNEWDWQGQAPNGGAVPGSAVNSTINRGDTLDRFGSRNGEYLSPVSTPLELRSLPPGKRADPYEQFPVLKPFTVVQEKIAPAFDQPGGGMQIRATIPEIPTGFANVNDLIRFGYLKDLKAKP